MNPEGALVPEMLRLHLNSFLLNSIGVNLIIKSKSPTLEGRACGTQGDDKWLASDSAVKRRTRACRGGL